MEEEEAPTLLLEILRGPREGETLEFKPGTAVRIGRVVKGNNLPIQDAGISSKHLTISIDSNKWTLFDLDSSNGTVLDGSPVPPHTAFTLRHGSTLKIGERTSIHVMLVRAQQQEEQQRVVKPRRNATRRGRAEPAPAESVQAAPHGRGRRKVQFQSVEGNETSVVDAESERVVPPDRVTRKTNRGRGVVKEDVCAAEGKDQARVQIQGVEEKKNASVVGAEGGRVGLRARVTRKRVGVCDDVASVAKEKVEEPRNTRAKRSSKNSRGVNAGNVERKTTRGVAEKWDLEKEVVDVKETCYGREEGDLNGDDGNWRDLKGRKRGAAEKRKLEKEGEDLNGVEETCGGREEGNPNGDNGNRNVWKKTKRSVTEKRELEKEGVEVTSDGREEGNLDGDDENLSDLNGMEEACDVREEGNSNGDNGKWNVGKKTKKSVTEKRELEKEGLEVTSDGKEKGNLDGDDENLPDLKRRKAGATENRELEKEDEDGNSVKEVFDGNWPDLNKMTLGEWFDFLEVYLPKQIVDETEEMIASMKQKAERLREYIVEMQQQNGEANMAVEE